MTSLLTHTVVHSTRPFYRPKATNQPLKKFLSLAVRWVKVIKYGKILTIKVNFSMSKIIRIFLKLFLIEEYDFRGTFFVNDTFWKLHFLNHFIFLKWHPISDDFYSTDHKTQKLFKGLAIAFELKGIPGRMCNIVR